MANETKKTSKAAAARARAAKLRERGGEHTGGFVSFVREQGVVGLAVGLAIGVSAGAAVKSIVDNFINPIVGFILGGLDLSKMAWKTGLTRGGHELVFGWGAILSAIITLLATAFVIYWLVHIIRLDRLDKAKE